MNDDEGLITSKPEFLPGQVLDDLSVDELEAIIAMLHKEIARLEQAKSAKKSQLSAAEALFAKK